MNILPKYILSVLMIVGTASVYAMDRQGQPTANLQEIATQPVKKPNKLNLQSILSIDLLKYEILEFLCGHVRPSLVFLDDRGIIPWIIVKQRHAIVQAVDRNDCEGLKSASRLLNFYRSLFLPSKALKTSDFIKNYQYRDGNTLLHNALSHYNNANIVKLLLDKNAKIDVRNNEGDTILHKAAEFSDDSEVVKFLLDHGAKIDATNKKGETPLHKAAGSYDTLCSVNRLKILLYYGAKIDATNKEGETPLQNAIRYKRKWNLELLLYSGANVDIPGSNGWTPDKMTINCEMKIIIDETRIGRVAQELKNALIREIIGIDNKFSDICTLLYNKNFLYNYLNLELTKKNIVKLTEEEMQVTFKKVRNEIHSKIKKDAISVIIDGVIFNKQFDALQDDPILLRYKKYLNFNGIFLDDSIVDVFKFGPIKQTVLHLAVSSNNKNRVQWLLNAGANPDYKNTLDQTPDDCTTDPEIKDLIVQARIDRLQKAISEEEIEIFGNQSN